MNPVTEYIPIVGMHCAGCAAAVTNKLQGLPGVVQATAQIDTHSLYIVYDNTQITRQQLADEVASLGFSLILSTDETAAVNEALEQERRSARSLTWRTAVGLLIIGCVRACRMPGLSQRWSS